MIKRTSFGVIVMFQYRIDTNPWMWHFHASDKWRIQLWKKNVSFFRWGMIKGVYVTPFIIACQKMAHSFHKSDEPLVRYMEWLLIDWKWSRSKPRSLLNGNRKSWMGKWAQKYTLNYISTTYILTHCPIKPHHTLSIRHRRFVVNWFKKGKC